MFRKKIGDFIQGEGNERWAFFYNDPVFLLRHRLVDELQDISLNKMLLQRLQLQQRSFQLFLGDRFVQVVYGIKLKTFQQVFIKCRGKDHRKLHQVFSEYLKGVVIGELDIDKSNIR